MTLATPMGGFAPDYLLKQQSYASLNTNTALNQLLAGVSAANKATQKRLEQATAIYDELINRYRSGGAFEKAALGQLKTQKAIETGKEKQSLISSGLSGTTIMGGVGRRWEAEVGAPARLKLEDIMMQRLSQAQLQKAGLLERVEDVGPSYSDVANLAGSMDGGHTYSQTINWPKSSNEPNLIDISLPQRAASTGPITRKSAGLPERPASLGQLYDPMAAKPLPEYTGQASVDLSLEAYRQYARGILGPMENVTSKSTGQKPIGYEAWKKMMQRQ